MPATFDTDFRVSEYLEAKAFPEYVRTPVPAPASVRAAWNYRDDMDAINEAELALERGCGLWERHIHLATLAGRTAGEARAARSEEHTSELQSLMRISYAVFCLKKKKHT